MSNATMLRIAVAFSGLFSVASQCGGTCLRCYDGVENCSHLSRTIFSIASQCGVVCLSGRDVGCPDNESCYLVLNCNMYCGSSLRTCESLCNPTCSVVTTANAHLMKLFIVLGNVAGFSFALASVATCSWSCPSDVPTECPSGESCVHMESGSIYEVMCKRSAIDSGAAY